MTLGDVEVPVSGSVGVAYYGADGCSLSELIKRADERMYKDKLLHHKERSRL